MAVMSGSPMVAWTVWHLVEQLDFYWVVSKDVRWAGCSVLNSVDLMVESWVGSMGYYLVDRMENETVEC